MDNFLTLKNTSLSVTLIWVFAYLWIDHEVFFLYTFLLFIDFLTGFVKSIILKTTSSRRALRGFLSKFMLLFMILSIWVFGKINEYDMSYILSGAFFSLSLAELYSIIGNIYQIRTGKKIKEYDAVAKILSYFLSFISKRLDRIIEDKTDRNDTKWI